MDESPNGPEYARTQAPQGGSGLPPSPLENPLARAAHSNISTNFIQTNCPSTIVSWVTLSPSWTV